MKRKPVKPGVIALTLFLLYVLGLTVGVFVIAYLPSGAKSGGFTLMTRRLAAQYMAGESIEAATVSRLAAITYDADGQLLDFFRNDTRRIDHDFIGQGREDLQAVLQGKETLRLLFFVKDSSSLGYTSLLYVGVPMVADGQTVGAMFWVGELPDLLETIVGYVSVFTLVFALAAVFMWQSLRNQRRYEQMRGNYIDNITHELKSPIASIKTLVDALSDGMEKNANDRNVYYGMILHEANRQERMICDTLELSKLQSYHMKISCQIVDADNVIRPAFEKYASLCDLKDITFSLSGEVASLPDLYTNTKNIQQVLEALLGNALKFVRENGEIRVGAQVSRTQVTFCVEDNGKGIAKADLPHVFERFYKCNRDDNEFGSGLGLAIAKESMDSINEKLWMYSEEGVGTRAYFTVRRASFAHHRPKNRKTQK